MLQIKINPLWRREEPYNSIQHTLMILRLPNQTLVNEESL